MYRFSVYLRLKIKLKFIPRPSDIFSLLLIGGRTLSVSRSTLKFEISRAVKFVVFLQKFLFVYQSCVFDYKYEI